MDTLFGIAGRIRLWDAAFSHDLDVRASLPLQRISAHLGWALTERYNLATRPEFRWSPYVYVDPNWLIAQQLVVDAAHARLAGLPDGSWILDEMAPLAPMADTFRRLAYNAATEAQLHGHHSLRAAQDGIYRAAASITSRGPEVEVSIRSGAAYVARSAARSASALSGSLQPLGAPLTSSINQVGATLSRFYDLITSTDVLEVFSQRVQQEFRRTSALGVVTTLNLANLARPEVLTATSTILLSVGEWLGAFEDCPALTMLLLAWKCLGSTRVILDIPNGMPAPESRIKTAHRTTGALLTVLSMNKISWQLARWYGAVAGVYGAAVIYRGLVYSRRSYNVETTTNDFILGLRIDLTGLDDNVEDLLAAVETYGTPRLRDAFQAGYHTCEGRACTTPNGCDSGIHVFLNTQPALTTIPLPAIIKGERKDEIIYTSLRAIEVHDCGEYHFVTHRPGVHVWYNPELPSVHGANLAIDGEDVVVRGNFGTERVPICVLVTVGAAMALHPRDDYIKFTNTMRSYLTAKLGACRVETKYLDILVMLVGSLADEYACSNLAQSTRLTTAQPSFHQRLVHDLFAMFPRGSSFDSFLTIFAQRSKTVRKVLPWKWVVAGVPQYTMIIPNRRVQIATTAPIRPPFPNAGQGAPPGPGPNQPGNPGGQPNQHGGQPGNPGPQHGPGPQPACGVCAQDPCVCNRVPNQQPGAPVVAAAAPAQIGAIGVQGNPQPNPNPQAPQNGNNVRPRRRCCGACEDVVEPGKWDVDFLGCRCRACEGHTVTWDDRHIPPGNTIHTFETRVGDATVQQRFVTLALEQDYKVSLTFLRDPEYQTSLSLDAFQFHQRTLGSARLEAIIVLADYAVQCTPGAHDMGETFRKYLRSASRHLHGAALEDITDLALTGDGPRVLASLRNGLAQVRVEADGLQEVGEEVPPQPANRTGARPRVESRQPNAPQVKRRGGDKLSQGRNDHQPNGPPEHQPQKGRVHGGSWSNCRQRGEACPQGPVPRQRVKFKDAGPKNAKST